jgi:(p)ppGpp synthase/HD superfamily hydrolase
MDHKISAKKILFDKQKYLTGLLLGMDCAIDLNVLTRDGIYDAYQFASAAHGATGQVRKYTGLPYISHLVNVAMLVNSVTQDRRDNVALVSGALLHDVREDTAITSKELQNFFGQQITSLVESVTNPSVQFPELPRYERKKMDREALIGKGYATHTLKLADVIDNGLTVVHFDPEYAKTSVAEAHLLIDLLTDGDNRLRRIAYQITEDNLAHLHTLRLKPKMR